MRNPPSLFTIERRGRPASPHRYLTVTDDGDFAWGTPSTLFAFFTSEHAAELFRTERLGEHADDARVVRHSIH